MLSSLRSLQSKQTCPLPRVQEPDVIRLSYLAGECIRRTFWLLVTEAQVNIEAKGILWLMQLADLRMWQVSGVDGLCSLLSLVSLAVHRLNWYQQVGSSSCGLELALCPPPQHFLSLEVSLRHGYDFQVHYWAKLCSLWSKKHNLFISYA